MLTQDASLAFRQYLEGLQLAGVTHLPIGVAPDIEAFTESAPKQTKAPVPAPAALAPAPIQAPQAPTTQRPAPPVVAPQTPSLPITKTAVTKDVCQLSREERIQQLSETATAVAACMRCPQLASTRKQTVFGVGNPEANIMFIGEAPGADEDRQGEPFVGRAGQLLNRIISACKLTREEIYICNILRCRPPGNRNPTPIEAAECREYLDAQIRIVDPDYIVCWGSVAAQNLLDTTDSVGRMRKKFFNYGRAKVTCTYHPSYLLRNESAKKQVWDDMKWLFADMGVDLSQK